MPSQVFTVIAPLWARSFQAIELSPVLTPFVIGEVIIFSERENAQDTLVLVPVREVNRLTCPNYIGRRGRHYGEKYSRSTAAGLSGVRADMKTATARAKGGTHEFSNAATCRT